MEVNKKGKTMCDTGACFSVVLVGDDMIKVVSDYQDPSDDENVNFALDTLAAWITFRDEIKAGKYDHIGE